MFVILAPALVLALAAAAPATDPAASDKPEKKICRTVQSTGSRMGAARDCRTKAEWQAAERGREGDLTKRANDTLNTGGYNGGLDGPPGMTAGSPR